MQSNVGIGFGVSGEVKARGHAKPLSSISLQRVTIQPLPRNVCPVDSSLATLPACDGVGVGKYVTDGCPVPTVKSPLSTDPAR